MTTATRPPQDVVPGQSTDPLDTITAIYQSTREDEFGDVCHWIVQAAQRNGEYHADDAAEWNLTERNLLGIAIRHLQRNGIIESTGEHRVAAKRVSHRRRSYVYRLTPLGKRAATNWPRRKPTQKSIDRADSMFDLNQPAQQCFDLNGIT